MFSLSLSQVRKVAADLFGFAIGLGFLISVLGPDSIVSRLMHHIHVMMIQAGFLGLFITLPIEHAVSSYRRIFRTALELEFALVAPYILMSSVVWMLATLGYLEFQTPDFTDYVSNLLNVGFVVAAVSMLLMLFGKGVSALHGD